ncbi:pseudouridine synthase [Gammaproteobacteria bacterium]|nr:pseudouridine synthase [Gammaproteobacteria bacterium]
MPRLLLLNKPFGVLSQFSGEPNQTTLATFLDYKGFYPAGRLDKDSEGLLILTDNGGLQNKIANPRFKLAKTYLVQVEGMITSDALTSLSNGVVLKDGQTRPAEATIEPTPHNLWARDPPIRLRHNIPTSWIRLIIHEGKNRQVRRMTAATGFPTLRLIRLSVGAWELGELQPGQYIQMEV